MKRSALLFASLCLVYLASGQNKVGIGTTTPDPSSKVDIQSSNSGLLVPRMSTAQRNLIAAPANGLLVYDTNTNSFWYYKTGTGWTEVGSGSGGSSDWTLLGSDLLNNNSGGVGIGPVANTPLRAGLVVDKKVGAANALFGSDTKGISIESNYPTIGFNTYNYTGTRKHISNGYGSFIENNTASGDISWYTVDSTAADVNTINTLRFRMSRVGNVGLQGLTNPLSPLSFANTIGNKINLYQTSSANQFGIGCTGGRTLFYVPDTVNDFSWGTGNGIAFVEYMRFTGDGNLGIGTSGPLYKLDVNGRMRLRHLTGQTAGVWFNNSNNSEASFLGQQNDSTIGIYDNTNWFNWVLRFDHKHANLGIGFTTPKYPLTFEDQVGDKISLWGGNTSATGNHYGLGIQGYELQMFVPDNTAHIAFGYGNSNNFSELGRIEGNGQLLMGTSSSNYYAHFKHASSGSLQLENTVPHNTGATNNLLFKTGSMYNGMIRTTAYGTALARLGFFTYATANESGLLERMSILDNGDVLIGTTDQNVGGGYKLRVNGKVICTELRVQTLGLWPDYVFADSYKLMPLSDLRNFINRNKHLPNIPSAAQVSAEGGIDAGDMQKRLTEKVEELTLYILDLQKQIDELKNKQ